MSGTREGIMTTKRTLSAGLLGGIAMYKPVSSRFRMSRRC